jgi:outer membrane murein-binding lipoprotein Lpp
MNRRTTFAAAAVAVVSSALLAGCSDPTPVRNEKLKTETQSGRINVTSAQVINDARGYSRDILVLRDTETGREYIAVMGAGVTEMRTQSNGKTTYQVEE